MCAGACGWLIDGVCLVWITSKCMGYFVWRRPCPCMRQQRLVMGGWNFLTHGCALAVLVWVVMAGP